MDRGLARILSCIRRDNDGHVVIIITRTYVYTRTKYSDTDDNSIIIIIYYI